MTYSIPLQGPRLKVARAKRHIEEIWNTWVEHVQSDAYTKTEEISPDGTQKIHRVRVHKCIPPEFSGIIGDAAHNLRSALDQLVCELIRANHNQPRTRSGFPVATSAKRFEEAVVSKIGGVSPKAERFIRRLKQYNGGNTPLDTP